MIYETILARVTAGRAAQRVVGGAKAATAGEVREGGRNGEGGREGWRAEDNERTFGPFSYRSLLCAFCNGRLRLLLKTCLVMPRRMSEKS